jgi:hypothetical protein
MRLGIATFFGFGRIRYRSINGMISARATNTFSGFRKKLDKNPLGPNIPGRNTIYRSTVHTSTGLIYKAIEGTSEEE